MVGSMEECRMAACAVRGAIPPLLKCVPKVCGKARTSTVRPRSSCLGIPASFRSRLRIRISPAGTLNNSVSVFPSSDFCPLQFPWNPQAKGRHYKIGDKESKYGLVVTPEIDATIKQAAQDFMEGMKK